MTVTSSIFTWNDADGTDPASHSEGITPHSLGDIALFIGGIKGECADEFIKLNERNIWRLPLPHMPTDIPLDCPILCHSFLRQPIGSSYWHHGAISKTSTSTREKPRDMLYPLNEKSGISSSMLRVDYTRGPKRKYYPRVTPLSRDSSFAVCIGRYTFNLFQGEKPMVLHRPAQISFAGGRLSYWMWIPTLNRAEEEVFKANVTTFIDRSNCLDMAYFPGIATPGEGTQAPSPRGSPPPDYPKRRTGLSGTVYEKVGEVISKGGFREVFRVKIIPPEPDDQPDDQPKLEQPVQELVAKEIFHKGNDPSTKQWFREMQEDECRIVMNNPNPHINAIIDIAYMPGRDDRPWIIEEYQPYCLDAEKLPFDVDAEDMAWQLVSGLKHYHDNDIMHRDIKPGNILMRPIDDPKNGNPRWLFKFTDHGMVRPTNHPVEGLAGTGWYCAPEILDREPYNGKADIFSLGVELLGPLAGYWPPVDTPYPKSSFAVRTWMIYVGRFIRTNCPRKWQPLLWGMLMRDPDLRWSAGQCLAFIVLMQEPWQRRDKFFSMRQMIPWTSGPLSKEEIEAGRKRKYDQVDDTESDDEITVIMASPKRLPDGSEAGVDNWGDDIANLNDFDDIVTGNINEPSETSTVRAPEKFMKGDAPATPKASYAAQLPVTPRQGPAEKDGLASVPCTPVVDENVRSPIAGRMVTEPEEVFYFTDNGWDWDKLNEKDAGYTQTDRGNRLRKTKQLLAPAWAPAASKYGNRTTKHEPERDQRSLLVMGVYRWDLVQLFKPAKATTTAKPPLSLSARTSPDLEHENTIIEHPSEQEDWSTSRFVSSQQMTKSMQQGILGAEDCVPAEGSDSDSVMPVNLDPNDFVFPKPPSQSGGRADSEAPTEVEPEGLDPGDPVRPAKRKNGQRNVLGKLGTNTTQKPRKYRWDDDARWMWNLDLKGMDNMNVIR